MKSDTWYFPDKQQTIHSLNVSFTGIVIFVGNVSGGVNFRTILPSYFIAGRKRDSRGPTPTMDNGKYVESSIPVMGVTVYSTARTESNETKPSAVKSLPRCKDYDGNSGFSVFSGGWSCPCFLCL